MNLKISQLVPGKRYLTGFGREWNTDFSGIEVIFVELGYTQSAHCYLVKDNGIVSKRYSYPVGNKSKLFIFTLYRGAEMETPFVREVNREPLTYGKCLEILEKQNGK